MNKTRRLTTYSLYEVHEVTMSLHLPKPLQSSLQETSSNRVSLRQMHPELSRMIIGSWAPPLPPPLRPSLDQC